MRPAGLDEAGAPCIGCGSVVSARRGVREAYTGRCARDSHGRLTRELVISAGGVQTACVIDVREAEAVLAKLAEARRRFEKGGGVPTAVHDLLVELAAAIAESGPVELDVSPGRWLRIQTRMSGLLESLNNASAQESAARARKALRQLQRVFKRGRRLRTWRARFNDARCVPSALVACYLAIFAGTTWLIGSHRHSGVTAVLLSLLSLFLLFSFFVSIVVTRRATIAAGGRELAAMHAPEERCLFASRLPRRQLVIATDQRVFAVSAPLRLRRSQPLWSLPYSRITSVAPAKDSNARHVTLHARADTDSVVWPVVWSWSTGAESGDSDPHKAEQQALLMIVGRRLPSPPRTGSRRASNFGFG
jgi:hypothetical protein